MLGPTLTRWAPSLQPPTTPPTTPSPAEHEFSAIAKAKLPVVDLRATRFALAEPWSVILAAGGAGFRQALDRPRCQGPPLAIRLLRLTLQTASLAAAGALPCGRSCAWPAGWRCPHHKAGQRLLPRRAAARAHVSGESPPSLKTLAVVSTLAFVSACTSPGAPNTAKADEHASHHPDARTPTEPQARKTT